MLKVKVEVQAKCQNNVNSVFQQHVSIGVQFWLKVFQPVWSQNLITLFNGMLRVWGVGSYLFLSLYDISYIHNAALETIIAFYTLLK